MKIATFILENMEPILQEWESFAQTLFKDSQNKTTLRDHAKKMLLAIVRDLQQAQTKREQDEKSKGLQERDNLKDTAAEEHGVARMEEGFSMVEIAAEYRALRASVTKLWGNSNKVMHASDMIYLVRFNEAIDQALSESISSYMQSKEQKVRHLDVMLSVSPDLSYLIDTKGVLLYVNKAMCELYQKPASDLVGKVFYDLENLSSDELDHIQAVLDSKETSRGDRVFKAPNGKEHFFEYIYSPVLDEKGKIEAIAGTSRDITERKIFEEKIWNSAHYDDLTGLSNRRLFRDRLDQAVKQAKRENRSFALLSIDLDRFKQINDKMGHAAGDLLLQQASKRITTCLRESDTVARMGGDEFSVFLSNVYDAEQTKIVIEDILAELAKPYQIEQQQVDVSSSIGITLCPQDGVELDVLLGNADKAMYMAKKSGRNRYCFYSEIPD